MSMEWCDQRNRLNMPNTSTTATTMMAVEAPPVMRRPRKFRELL